MWKTRNALTILVILCVAFPVSATSFLTRTDHQVVGKSSTVLSKFEDTIYSIALEYRVGADALVSANPDVDPWLPGEGVAIELPTHYVLPNVKREGIVINLPEMRLYYFSPGNSSVHVYPVGIGRQGWETPLLESTISSIVKNPTWTPPQSIHLEYKKAGLDLPKIVPAGTDNPLGEYALRIGQSSYLIHGTNNPKGVGLRVSHGCIRLYPEHIAELASLIDVDTPVAIINQPIKLGRDGSKLYLQAHKPVQGDLYNHSEALHRFFENAKSTLSPSELSQVKRLIRESLESGELYSGVALPVI